MKDHTTQALAVLRAITDAYESFVSVKDASRLHYGADWFGAPMPPTVDAEIVALLDDLLGDEIASYWLYEARIMKGGGLIETGGKTWPICSMDDVEAYIRERDQ